MNPGHMYHTPLFPASFGEECRIYYVIIISKKLYALLLDDMFIFFIRQYTHMNERLN